jgi:holo-[acyl-carrier protein] synthase
MAVIGIGTDLASIPRVRRLLERHGPRFRARVFTPSECAACDTRSDPAPHFAVRFAAKEAALKAMGLGRTGELRWTDAAVERGTGQAPELRFSGALEARATAAGVRKVHLSLTHDGDHALAFVVLES